MSVTKLVLCLCAVIAVLAIAPSVFAAPTVYLHHTFYSSGDPAVKDTAFTDYFGVIGNVASWSRLRNGDDTSLGGAGTTNLFSIANDVSQENGAIRTTMWPAEGGVVLRWKDSNNYLVVGWRPYGLVFQETVGGVTGEEYGVLELGGYINSEFAAAVIGDTVYAQMTDDTGQRPDISFFTSATIQSPVLKSGAGQFGLRWYASTPGQSYEYCDITTPYCDIAGTVTDSSTGAPIVGATVQIVGSGSTPTGSDGTYSFSDLTMGLWQVSVTASGHVGKIITVNPRPGLVTTANFVLDPLGMDYAPAASASASSTDISLSASSINDANPNTGWSADSSIAPPGEWVQLAWPAAETIKTVLVDSAGPVQDYNVEYSLNGTDWTLASHVTSTDVGHTHWLDTINLPSPTSMQYLRVVVNVPYPGSAGRIFSVECYKATGTVSGYVKSSSGAGIVGATVMVNEVVLGSRGASRLMVKGTTGADGHYTVAVPQGTAMVSAMLPDTFIVSTNPAAPIVVASGGTTTAPDLVLTPINNSGVTFSDTFDSTDCVPDTLWSNVQGTWTKCSGTYSALIDPVDPWNPGNGGGSALAIVNGLSARDCVVDVDRLYEYSPANQTGGGVIARYTDLQNFLLGQLQRNVGDPEGNILMWHEVYNGAATQQGPSVTAPLDEPNIHFRFVVGGSHGQLIASDQFSTYWTDGNAQNLAGFNPKASGTAGLLHSDLVSLTCPRFDNFTVTSGSGAAGLSTVGDAKKGGPGWSGDMQGVVTAIFTDYNYLVIESTDRSAALKVSPLIAGLAVGDKINLEGSIRPDGSVAVLGDVAVVAQNVAIDPVGAKNKDIVTGAGSHTSGLDNKYLLVGAWGKVLDNPTTLPDGTKVFHIDDGSAGSATMWNLAYSDDWSIPPHTTGSTDAAHWTTLADWIYAGGSFQCQGGQFVTPSTTWTGAVLTDPSTGGVLKLSGDYEMTVTTKHSNPYEIYTGILCDYDGIDAGGARSILLWISANMPNAYMSWIQFPGFNWIAGMDLPGIDISELHWDLKWENGVGTCVLTDGTGKSYSSSYSGGPNAGRFYPAGGVGISAYMAGHGYDDFKLYTKMPAGMEVAIPPSVIGTPTIAKDDYVRAVGIANTGIATDASGVIVRDATELTIQ
ncbi:MAG: carboxypeptidase regulatory-like domain-containing protein [Armatimonadota bacterium]